jgi:hypothetical protein
MVTLFVRHEVEDYARWRKEYDDFDSLRKGMGVVSDSVHRGDDDPNMITVTHGFANMSAAKEFAASDELRQAMHKAGVTGQPDIWFTEDV